MEIIDIDETNTGRRYAGFWIRFAALIIDSIILGFFIAPLQYLYITSGTESGMMESGFPAFGWTSRIAIIFLEVVYFAVFTSSKYQATPGKMAVGIQVISEQGGRISFGNAVGRFFSKILSAIILYIGFIMAAFDRKKQALHDKMASTYVVYKN